MYQGPPLHHQCRVALGPLPRRQVPADRCLSLAMHSRRQTRLTALDLLGFAAADERPQQFVHMGDDELEAVLTGIKVRPIADGCSGKTGGLCRAASAPASCPAWQNPPCYIPSSAVHSRKLGSAGHMCSQTAHHTHLKQD